MDNKTLARYRRKLAWINWYPPYWGAGIRLHSISEDCTRIEARMRLRWFNKNLFGTHFGGSLYSMCDPFYAFILVAHLGKNFVVWDKSSRIDFRKPGTGTVRAVFEIPLEQIAAIRQELTDGLRKKTYFFTTKILNEADELVAEVEKEVYVRRLTEATEVQVEKW